MHPATHARVTPLKAACIDASSGQTLGYRGLDARANQAARLMRRLHLERGDVVANLLDNGFDVFELAWAAQRSGLYCTSLSTRFVPADLSYILQNSAARLLVASDRLAQAAAAGLPEGHSIAAYLASSSAAGMADWRAAREREPAAPIADESAGADMLYSSGTTGRPKGVKPALPTGPIDEPTALMRMGQSLYGMGHDTRYLSTSPLYHAAPLRWAMTVQRLGGTVIITDHFDAERTLALIEEYGVTHATFVPTHFVRMLKLSPAVRARYDLSSLQVAVHAAAPCPVPIKRAMIEWWGPIIHEYYSGTEMCGITALSSAEWLSKPGSVGRAVLGSVRITDDHGEECLAHQIGNVYFADGPRFEYHDDPQKTAEAYDRHGWATLGDIGHLDEDGYLFLTDRKNFMIISGGVNIYPQEIENCLISHPQVADAAVIGAPDEEMGERVVAVVQPVQWQDATPELAAELRRFARSALGGVKCPRQFDFRRNLPREPTGKLLKRLLRDEYAGARKPP